VNSSCCRINLNAISSFSAMQLDSGTGAQRMVSNCKSQDLKTLVSHTGLGDLLFKLLSAAEKIGYYVSRGCLCQARDLASGDLRHPLCVAHAHTGTGSRHFGKNNHCNFRTHNVRSAGFLLFTSFSNIPHFGFGFAFRF
jgi:hypothetical protein